MQSIDEIEQDIISLVHSNKHNFATQWLTTILESNHSNGFDSEVLLLRAKCFQLKGQNDYAISDMSKIDTKSLSEKKLQEFFLIYLRIYMQNGNFKDAKDISNQLICDKANLTPTILWRTSFVDSIIGENKNAKALQIEHLDRIISGGFQEANNIIYAQTIPNIIRDSLPLSFHHALIPIEKAKKIYLSSNIDFGNQIGVREKSLCQALITESYINWYYGNRYTAYKLIVITGLFIDFCGLTPTAEGIGEIIYTLHKNNNPLKKLFYLCSKISQNRQKFDLEIRKFKDYRIINSVVYEAYDFFKDKLQQPAFNLNEELLIMFDEIKENKKSLCVKENKNFEKLMDSHRDNKRNFEKLLDKIKRNSVFPFIGAGISSWVYPMWSELLLQLSKEFCILDEVQSKLMNGEYEVAASLLEQKITEHDFRNKLADIFEPAKMQDYIVPEYLKYIPMIWKSNNIVTTNFDKVVEYIYSSQIKAITPHSKYDESMISNSIQNNNLLLLKLHGDIDDPWNLVLTKEKYDIFYGKSKIDKQRTIPKAISHILTSRIALFLGCSLSKDRTLSLVMECAKKGVEHFALVELPKSTENKEDPYNPNIIDKNGVLNIDYDKKRVHFSHHSINRIWYPYGKHSEAVDGLLSKIYQSL